MSDKKIQIIDKNSNNLFPKTTAELVINNDGDDLGGVEENAQVNVLETLEIKHGSSTTTVTIVNKKATIDLSEYAKSSTTLAGYGITNAYTKDETDAKITGALQPKGSILFSELPALSANYLNFMYNISNSFTTTSDFVEGSGKDYPAGTNVAIINIGTAGSPTYKYDAMPGTFDTSTYDSHISNSNIHVSSSDRNTWNGKQDTIGDLATIRTGAGKGATAVQPSDLATVATSGSYNDLTNKPTIPVVPSTDQTFDPTSTHPQSGVAIAGAISDFISYVEIV